MAGRRAGRHRTRPAGAAGNMLTMVPVCGPGQMPAEWRPVILPAMEPCPADRGPGRIILLNGASSSGKSTLAKALQQALPEPFLHVSSDHLVASGMLPPGATQTGRSPGKPKCDRGSSPGSTGPCPRSRPPATT